jgi:hypothetical protein
MPIRRRSGRPRRARFQIFRHGLSRNQRSAAIRVERRPERRHPPAAGKQSAVHPATCQHADRIATDHPVNPVTGSELTWSIKDTNNGPTVRYDYILPCGIAVFEHRRSQVFRTDLLEPVPSNLYSNDNKIASDHLPVFMVFANPFNTPFRLLSIGRDQSARLADLGILQQPAIPR